MSDQCDEDNRHEGDSADLPGQLLRLADFDRSKPSRIILEMREYWQSLRKGRAIPSRTDIEPRGIHRALDYAFIVERIAPGAARFRLAGRHLIDLMGMEVRGMPLCAVVNPASRGRFSDVLESVFKAPQIAELQFSSKADYARPELTGHMLLLPLKSDLGDVTRALGCLISEGELGAAPRRFDIASDKVMPIIEGGSTMSPSPSGTGMSDRPASLRRSEAQPRRKAPPTPPQPETPDSPEERRAMFKIISNNAAG